MFSSIMMNGRPFDPDDLEKAIADQMKDHLHEQISSIRHPTTGEFPIVHVTGPMGRMSLRVEGSPELLELVRERLAPDDLDSVALVETKSFPKAFLSYASEDREFAGAIAKALRDNGITHGGTGGRSVRETACGRRSTRDWETAPSSWHSSRPYPSRSHG